MAGVCTVAVFVKDVMGVEWFVDMMLDVGWMLGGICYLHTVLIQHLLIRLVMLASTAINILEGTCKKHPTNK
jgi:hypothetical protein